MKRDEKLFVRGLAVAVVAAAGVVVAEEPAAVAAAEWPAANLERS